MNPDNLTQLIQRGFRVTLGATSFFMETLQDSSKRDENLNKLNSDFHQLTDEWADRGEMTEREARNFVDTILTQQNSQVDTDSTTFPANPTSTPGFAQSAIQRDLLELTSEIAALRADLQKLQDSDSQN
jgi:polyhydroxyalkanoate synthesis regulator phasin